MRIDSLEIAGINGIEVPDGTTVGSEFTITARCYVSRLEQEQIDVSTEVASHTLPGPIRAGLVAIGEIEIA